MASALHGSSSPPHAGPHAQAHTPLGVAQALCQHLTLLFGPRAGYLLGSQFLRQPLALRVRCGRGFFVLGNRGLECHHLLMQVLGALAAGSELLVRIRDAQLSTQQTGGVLAGIGGACCL